MRIFIVPYRFLLQSLLDDINHKIDTTGKNLPNAKEIKVQDYTGAEIKADQIPEEMEKTNVVLLTLDAASKLVTHHMKSVLNGKIDALVIDARFKHLYLK